MSLPIDGLSHIYAKAHPTPSISIAMVAASLIQMPRPQAPHVKSRGLAAPDRSADLPPGVHDLIAQPARQRDPGALDPFANRQPSGPAPQRIRLTHRVQRDFH
jgi:hypothetical protein